MPSVAVYHCITEAQLIHSPIGLLMLNLAPLMSSLRVGPPSCLLGFLPSQHHLRQSLSHMLTHILFKLFLFPLLF